MANSSGMILGQGDAACAGAGMRPRNVLRVLSVLAALSFVGSACAQTAPPPEKTAQTPSAPNGPSTPSPSVTDAPTNPEMAGASTASRGDSPHPNAQQDLPRIAAAAPGKISAGMQVRSESGDLLGNVVSIVPAEANRESYVVVGSSSGIATPVPYSAANAMVQNDTLVVNKTRFEKAPKVQQYQREDVSRPAWEQKADSYWKRYAMSPEKSGAVNR